MPVRTPVDPPYRQALERCRATDAESLGAFLAVVLDALHATRGALFARLDDGSLALRTSSGIPAGVASTLPFDEAESSYGLVLLCPIRRRERTIGVIGLGPRTGGDVYGDEEQAFLSAAVSCAAAPLEVALLHDELRRLKQELALKAFQLHNLCDATHELNGGGEETVQSHIATTVMGHFLVSRSALWLSGPQGLTLAHERGAGRTLERTPIAIDEAQAIDVLPKPRTVAELPDGPLRRRFEQGRFALAVPLVASERMEGVLAIGERASRTPFSAEDLDFAEALARQAANALESARLHRLRIEKQRQDHELRIAQDIQRSLFPARLPEVPGFEFAALSRPCHEVGGDSYDWIDLGGGRLALVVADASGKGTPASLLMASVHAFVHARAGTDGPAQVVERLNRFLLARTLANQYVTLFYAELDASVRLLAYVNAGHVPPYHVARDRTVRRLSGGGPPLGLLEGATYAECHARLEPGEVVVMVTDGLTEAASPDESEFGGARATETLGALSAESAPILLDGLVAAVDAWTGPAGCNDDLTTLVLKVL